jgi:hypothetical protein
VVKEVCPVPSPAVINVPLKLTVRNSLLEELTALFRSLNDIDADPALPESSTLMLTSLGFLLQLSQDCNKNTMEQSIMLIPKTQ